MKLKKFFCHFLNPWTLRVSGMGCYTSKCEKSQNHCTLLYSLNKILVVTMYSLNNVLVVTMYSLNHVLVVTMYSLINFLVVTMYRL
jgi:hypothetical protein